MNGKWNLVAAAVIVIAVCAAYVVLSPWTDTSVDTPEVPSEDAPSAGGDGEEEGPEMDTIEMTVNGKGFTIVLEDTWPRCRWQVCCR